MYRFGQNTKRYCLARPLSQNTLNLFGFHIPHSQGHFLANNQPTPKARDFWEADRDPLTLF